MPADPSTSPEQREQPRSTRGFPRNPAYWVVILVILAVLLWLAFS